MLNFTGAAHAAAEFVAKEQLTDRPLWAKFVNQFRLQRDGENMGWRGEYWGKMMRGGALTYQYTQDAALYAVLEETVRDLLTVAEADGRVSTYTRETEFTGWDLWCRKYVLLGCEYFLECCEDAALRAEILTFLCRQADYILEHIGADKLSVTKASGHWYGINSASILEPMVRLYRLTEAPRYLEFAAYIVQTGGAEGIDMFSMAYEDKLLPYQYGVSKAYEMISCFEGLLEYALVTGEEKWKTAVINFGRAVLRSEVSVIGSCGVTHELFDHTVTRQTTDYDGVRQETCVTVTWMKFCARLLELTGDGVFADAMEQAFYNAYLGAMNTQHKICAYINERYLPRLGLPPAKDSFLPFDSYSPLIPDKRGKKTGGTQVLEDNTYYGCCACIGAAGVGVFLREAVQLTEDTLTVNFYEQGRAEWEGVALQMQTDYPADGKIDLHLITDRALTLRLRRPGWTGQSGYEIHRLAAGEHRLSLEFAMELRTLAPISWSEDDVYTENVKIGQYWVGGKQHVTHQPEEDDYICLQYGPLTLAADDRLGKAADSVFTFAAGHPYRVVDGGAEAMLRLSFEDEKGERFDLIDYASAGRDWNTTIAAWLKTK